MIHDAVTQWRDPQYLSRNGQGRVRLLNARRIKPSASPELRARVRL
ncbi:MAG: hypothetical protein PHT60_02835 [Acidiphilium sp.]|nr:hypothetical protein [Acidiphilium sp.]MDD4934691.1 hypothetical protein [Acidiphilium sp.]